MLFCNAVSVSSWQRVNVAEIVAVNPRAPASVTERAAGPEDVRISRAAPEITSQRDISGPVKHIKESVKDYRTSRHPS